MNAEKTLAELKEWLEGCEAEGSYPGQVVLDKIGALEAAEEPVCGWCEYRRPHASQCRFPSYTREGAIAAKKAPACSNFQDRRQKEREEEPVCGWCQRLIEVGVFDVRRAQESAVAGCFIKPHGDLHVEPHKPMDPSCPRFRDRRQTKRRKGDR